MKKLIFVFVSVAFLGSFAIPTSIQASSAGFPGITRVVVPADTCKMKCNHAKCCKSKGVACAKDKTKSCCKAKK